MTLPFRLPGNVALALSLALLIPVGYSSPASAMPSVESIQPSATWPPKIDQRTIEYYRDRRLAPALYRWNGKGTCVFNGTAMGCTVKGLRTDNYPAYRPIYEIHWADGVIQTIWLGSDASAFVASNGTYAYAFYDVKEAAGAATCSLRTSTNNTTVFPCVTNMNLWMPR